MRPGRGSGFDKLGWSPQTVFGEEAGKMPPGQDTVGRRPKLTLQAGSAKQIVFTVFVIGEIVVDTRAVCLEQTKRFAIEVGDDFSCRRGKAEASHQAVILECATPATLFVDDAEHFTHTTLDHTQEIVHLKSAVLGCGIPQTVHGPLVGLGKHVGNAPAVTQEFHLAVRRCRDCASRGDCPGKRDDDVRPFWHVLSPRRVLANWRNMGPPDRF